MLMHLGGLDKKAVASCKFSPKCSHVLCIYVGEENAARDSVVSFSPDTQVTASP